MCDLISWYELPNGKIRFLTEKQLFKTERGQALLKEYPDPKDWCGHQIIKEYYHSRVNGKGCECTDFSSPSNFPHEIAQAIKVGEYRGYISKEILIMLTPEALIVYAEREKAYDEWVKADAERVKADAEWMKAYDEWRKADAEWMKAYDEWRKADDEWRKADAEWRKAEHQHKHFWDLFAVIENRKVEWR